MPRLYRKHKLGVSLEREIEELWGAVDLLRKRESRIRAVTPGIPGGPAGSPGGTVAAGDFAPFDAEYLTLALDPTLVAERRLVVNSPILGTDGGAGGDYELDLDVIPISLGGTGQTTKTPAFDALAPGTTKGDIIVYNGSDHVRKAVGSNGFALMGASAAGDGLAWADHGGLAGLGDDDHLIYLPSDGSRAMTARLELDFTGGVGFTEAGAAQLDIVPGTEVSVTNVWTLPWVTARFNGTLFISTTAVGNVGSGEDDLISWSMPANTLLDNGHGVEIWAGGNGAANANSKRLRLKFGATTLLDSTASLMNTPSWLLHAFVWRTGSTTQVATASLISHNGAGAAQWADMANYTAPGHDLTTACTIKVTGEGVSDNDLVNRWLMVRFV